MRARHLAVARRRQINEWAPAFGRSHDLGALRAIFGGTYGPQPFGWVLFYTGGLAQLIDGRPEPPLVIPWSRLGHVVKTFEDSASIDGGYPHTPPLLVRVDTLSLDGTVITVDGRYGLEKTELARKLDAVVVTARLPAAATRLDSGAPLVFGELTVSQEAITWNSRRGGTFPWARIRSIELADGEIIIKLSNQWLPHYLMLTGGPDSYVAQLLIQQLAARYGIRQKGEPLPTPGRPLTFAQITGCSALLTEGDVSRVLGRPVRADARARDVVPDEYLAGFFIGGDVRVKVALWDGYTPEDWGRPWPGIGHEAWMGRRYAGGQTGVVRAGDTTVKITFLGRPTEPEWSAALDALMRVVAARLTPGP